MEPHTVVGQFTSSVSRVESAGVAQVDKARVDGRRRLG
jgi:hypothetical protein